MKTFSYLGLAAMAAVFMVGLAEGQSFRSMAFGESDNHTTLVIKSDGSSTLTNEAVQPRKSLEMQVNAWERFSKMSEEDTGPDDEDTPVATAKPGQKALTNEELASKLREMYQQRADGGSDAALSIRSVEVLTNSVRILTSRSFASIKELLSEHPYTWGPNALMFENARFELDTNHNLRITFTPNQSAGRYAKNVGREWKSAKMKFDWKLVLPGKILGSGLPNTQDSATWLSLDGEKPDTIDAVVKLIGPPLVITAESGGIRLDEPLESKNLVRAAWRQHKAEPDLPITDAAPGFLAEPVSITLSTVRYFPEGEKYFKDRPEGSIFGLGSTGTVVSAKLFPPKGREIKSVSSLKVKAARDDKGRPIPGIVEGNENAESYSEFRSYDSDESEKGGAARIELRMSLPAPDAKTIDELEGELVALTIGGWKEMVLTNVQADTNKEIDLSEVLPGAKLIVKKIGGRKPQKIVEASIEGPKEVSQIEVKIKLGTRRAGQSNMNERRSTTSGNKTTRNITVRAYQFEMGGPADSGPPTLLIRYPQDVKRERVQFKLTALDLL
jgi:hypothetical protein